MTALALRCDREGAVRAVLRDDVGVGAGAVGRPLVALLDPSSLTRGLDLLEEARRGAVPVGRELLVRGDPRPRVLVSAGASDEAGVLVLAAPTRRALRELGGELAAEGAAAEAIVRSIGDAPSGELGEVAFDELTRLYNELANLERDLAQKNARLERLSREKDRVLGMAAHDLRSPLDVILLSVEFLRMRTSGRLDAVEGEVLDRIDRSCVSMRRLVDDLLDTASLGSGTPSLVLAPVAVEPLLAEVVELHAPLAARSRVRVELGVEGDLPALEADDDRLRQVLGNLVSNAVRHTPEGGTVRLLAAPRPGGVELSVVDEGPGIDPEDLPRLFRPFARGRNTRSGSGSGSVGLGLAICRGLVEAHGGTIRAENPPGGGAAFRVHLPCAEG